MLKKASYEGRPWYEATNLHFLEASQSTLRRYVYQSSILGAYGGASEAESDLKAQSLTSIRPFWRPLDSLSEKIFLPALILCP